MRERKCLPIGTAAEARMAGLIKRAEGYGLATANILYRLPDSSTLVEEFIYQDYDHLPEFPRMRRLVRHWKQTLDGPLVAVTVWHELLDRPTPILSVDGLTLSIDRFATMAVTGRHKYN